MSDVAGSLLSGSASSKTSGVADGRRDSITEVGQLNCLKSSVRVSLFGVVLLSASNLFFMVQVALPLDVMANIMEVVEMPANIASRLVDLWVGVGVSTTWWFIGIDKLVAPRTPLEIGTIGLKTTSSLMIGVGPSWTHRSV